MSIIIAKYPGNCSKCGDRIAVGQRINYEKGNPTTHADCKPVEIPADAIHISGGSGYGCTGWTKGQVVINPEGSEPPYLYVLKASQRYIREDGLCFNVGDDSGYVYSATCRAATAQESAPLAEQVKRQREQKAAAVDLRQLERDFIERGEYLPGKHDLIGERVDVGEGQNIYGGGYWFVISDEYIWYVVNNGSDGADWSANNIITGGAGAIGRRLPHAPELAAKVRDLCAKAGQARG